VNLETGSIVAYDKISIFDSSRCMHCVSGIFNFLSPSKLAVSSFIPLRVLLMAGWKPGFKML